MDAHQLTYSIPEAAALLGVSRSTVARMIRDKTLPVIRLRPDGRDRIARRDLEELIERLRG